MSLKSAIIQDKHRLRQMIIDQSESQQIGKLVVMKIRSSEGRSVRELVPRERYRVKREKRDSYED